MNKEFLDIATYYFSSKEYKDVRQKIVLLIIRPFLAKFEQSCLKPFFPTYSFQRLRVEEIDDGAIEGAFLHTFLTKQLTEEERFLTVTLINQFMFNLNGLSSMQISDFTYVLLNYNENNMIKAHHYTNIFITIRQFLRERPTQNENSETFLSVCFGDFQRKTYIKNPCRLPIGLAMQTLTHKLVAFTAGRQILDTETIREYNVFDTKLPRLRFNGTLHFDQKFAVVGVDLQVPIKKMSPINKQLVLPTYKAVVYDGCGNPFFRSDSVIDEFLFKANSALVVSKTLNRIDTLAKALHALFPQKIVRDKIISYILIFENRYSAIVLWSRSPIVFREICIEENALCWPLMMPFNQQALFGAGNLVIDADYNENSFFVQPIYRDKNTRKSFEHASVATDVEVGFLNFLPLNNYEIYEFADKCTTKYKFETNPAMNYCVLIRSESQKNGPVHSITIDIDNNKIFFGEAAQTCVRVEKNGTEWHSCSLAPMTTNLDAITTKVGSNLHIDPIPDFSSRFDFATISVNWQKEHVKDHTVSIYLRCFNVSRDSNGMYGVLFT